MHKIDEIYNRYKWALGDKLYTYMRNNKIKLRSVAIKKCIEDATKEDDNDMFLEFDRKLNTMLYRQNLNRKILEQLFCNMGFAINQDVKKIRSYKKYMMKIIVDLRVV